MRTEERIVCNEVQVSAIVFDSNSGRSFSYYLFQEPGAMENLLIWYEKGKDSAIWLTNVLKNNKIIREIIDFCILSFLMANAERGLKD